MQNNGCQKKLLFRLEWKGQTSWNFIEIFLCSLLDHTKCPYNNWYGFCFHFPHPSNFNFRIFISAKIFKFLIKNIARYLANGTLISINWHVSFCLCLITMSESLTCIILSVLMGKSQRMVTFPLPLGVFTTGNGLCS